MQLPMADDELVRCLTIAAPCSARWQDMSGDERARFCNDCQLHVYNLSAMTTREAAALIREKEGKLCAYFYRREDGTVLTKDCPVGLRQRLRRQARRAGAIVASLLAAFTSISCSDDRLERERAYSTGVGGKVSVSTPVAGDGPVQTAKTPRALDKKSTAR